MAFVGQGTVPDTLLAWYRGLHCLALLTAASRPKSLVLVFRRMPSVTSIGTYAAYKHDLLCTTKHATRTETSTTATTTGNNYHLESKPTQTQP